MYTREGLRQLVKAYEASDPLLLINVITGGAASGEYFDLLQACKEAEGASTCPPDMKTPLDQLYALSRNPAGVPAAPTEVKIGVELSEGNEKPIRLEGVDFAALSAGAAKNEGYVTIAFDDGVPGATTTLSVIRVECATDPLVTGSFPYPGVAFTVDGANVFGTNFALRHGVAVATAEGLSADPTAHRDRLRLTFARPEADLRAAVDRLAAAWADLAGR